MSKTQSFKLPFGIDFVVSEDLKVIDGFRTWKASGCSYDITCPFCGGKRKMNVNTAKNVAKCNKCGGGNGYNTITLHAALTGLSNAEAYKDLKGRWNHLDSNAKVIFTPKEELKDTLEPASIEIRDMVYRRLLNNLSLSDKHFEDLKKRGLTKEQIDKGLYKSVPVIGLHTLAYDAVYRSGAIKAFDNHKYWGIPGFTDIKDPKKIAIRGRKSGYFVPVIQKDGLISGMQIRYDDLPINALEKEKEEYKKYSWYSSSEKPTGCSVTGCENIHFAGNFKEIPKEINLTEGVLKADIASILSGKCFLGLVGVNNIGQLGKALFHLQHLGTQTVKLYIDMDYKEKKEVASALLEIKKTINKVGQHSYQSMNENKELTIRQYSLHEKPKEGFQKGVKLIYKDIFQKNLFLILDKTLISSDKLFVLDNEIQIEFEYINCIRNREHTIRIFNAEKGFENWENLTKKERQSLLEKSFVSSITFCKTGLNYEEMNWNESYKGIDDYYLYLRSIKGQN